MLRIFFGMSLALFLLTAYLPSHPEQSLDLDSIDFESKEQVLVQLTTTFLNKWHYQPQAIDDEYSKKAFDTYMKYIDGSKRFLLKSEVEELRKNERFIDDEIKDGSLAIFNEVQSTFVNAIDRAEGICMDILSKPMNLNDIEKVELDGEKRDYAGSEEALRDYWRKWLEHEVLEKLYTNVNKQDKRIENEADYQPVGMDSLQRKSIEKVEDVFSKWFKRLDKRDSSDYFSTYLNVLTNIYDPHTNFYKPRDKESFDISMAGKLEGIGARLSSDGEETKVVSIVPGSPSWKQGDLEVKDVILEVAQGDNEAVDIAAMAIDDVVDLIRGDKGTEVKLTVRKIDGEISIVPIIRDVVVLEEGFAKSMIVEHDAADVKVGYLKLPKFYADFQDRNGRSSAKDVKTELLKLKEEGAEALIFDLRGNTGGSLRDVVKIVGHFIEEGPVVQVKNRNQTIEVLADKDGGEVVWDGPVVVMVNKFSASASEIFAAAMQDYNRAMIVGSPYTYGKGTVQRFIDLDRTINGNVEFKPLGSVKYTMQKYFRINGGTTQHDGVLSDIVMPDAWHYTTTGERELDFSLPVTKIEPAEYDQDVMDLSGIKSDLIKMSSTRISNNETFSKILADAKRVKDEQDKSEKLIEKDAFFEARAEDKKLSDSYEDLFEPIDKIKTINLLADMDHIQMDSSRIERNEKWQKSLTEDIYLQESIFIIKDMMAKL